MPHDPHLQLGKLAGEEDGLAVDLRDAKMTDPAYRQAAKDEFDAGKGPLSDEALSLELHASLGEKLSLADCNVAELRLAIEAFRTQLRMFDVVKSDAQDMAAMHLEEAPY